MSPITPTANLRPSRTTSSLASIFQRNKQALVTSQQQYVASVLTVNMYATAVLSSSLPTLNSYPADWNAYTTAYEQATGDALQWVNQVMGRLLQVPDDVMSYNTEIVALLTDAANQAAALVRDPGNTAAQTALLNDLRTLSSQLQLVSLFIQGAVDALTDFNNTLPAQAANLQSIATMSAADSDADQQQIAQLAADVQSLNDQITRDALAIATLGIGAGVAILFSSVATIAAWPVGAVTWLFTGPIIAVAGYYIVLDSIDIANCMNKIASDQQQMDSLTADASTLSLLSQTFTSLATASETVVPALQKVLEAWNELESDINAAIADVTQGMADYTSEDWSAVQADIDAASQAWSETYTEAGNLVLDLQASTAQISLGMSSSQVQAAVQSAPTVGFLAYLNG